MNTLPKEEPKAPAGAQEITPQDLYFRDVIQAFSNTAMTASALRADMVLRLGVAHKGRTLPFFQSFNWLMTLTKPLKEMKDADELIVRIDTWFKKPIDTGDGRLAMEGVLLFESYAALLVKRGVISLR
jgi:hypothetical protein